MEAQKDNAGDAPSNQAGHFTLIGFPTLVFSVMRRFMMAEDIPCVHGLTLDAKHQTTARVADVVFCDAQGAPVSRQEALKRGEAWANIDIPRMIKD
jgi:hypothetical protein